MGQHEMLQLQIAGLAEKKIQKNLFRSVIGLPLNRDGHSEPGGGSANVRSPGNRHDYHAERLHGRNSAHVCDPLHGLCRYVKACKIPDSDLRWQAHAHPYVLHVENAGVHHGDNRYDLRVKWRCVHIPDRGYVHDLGEYLSTPWYVSLRYLETCCFPDVFFMVSPNS